jgi:hypothetical protein
LRESKGEERAAFLRHESIEKRIGQRATKVLSVLISHSDTKGKSRLPRSEIAKKARLGEENTKAALKILYRSGLVSMEEKERDCIVRKLNFILVGNLAQIDLPTLDRLKEMNEHGGRRENSGRKNSNE